jgi:hypothetical protein
VAGLAGLAALPGCGRGSAAHAGEAAPAREAAQAAPPNPASDRLPEDPALGAKATAQWRDFMKQEERERQLRFDRGKLKEHRAVLRLIVGTRARLDRAKTPTAIAAQRARLPPAIEEIHQRITALDHWGVNSNLLPDYDAILEVLADDYPAARLAALAGDGTYRAALRGVLDARQKKIKDWLEEAAATEDE